MIPKRVKVSVVFAANRIRLSAYSPTPEGASPPFTRTYGEGFPSQASVSCARSPSLISRPWPAHQGVVGVGWVGRGDRQTRARASPPLSCGRTAPYVVCYGDQLFQDAGASPGPARASELPD